MLVKALNDYRCDEFIYESDWIWFEPTHTIIMNGEPIHMTHNLYFDFGKKTWMR